MKLFIADILIYKNIKEFVDLFYESDFNLETFFDIKGKELFIKKYIELKGQDAFLLDSGAFSLFSGTEKDLSYKKMRKYIDRYCDYVSRYNIKNFIEMDIDRIIGYDKVKEIREYITNRVGRKPIEVWHEWRGQEDFNRACQENHFICIGIKGFNIETIQPIIDEAYKYNCRVHVLGYTPMYLEKFKNIYSCDSTTWMSGGRYGQLYQFNNDTIGRIKMENKHRKTDTENTLYLNQHNLKQWIKYQKFLKEYGWKVK